MSKKSTNLELLSKVCGTSDQDSADASNKKIQTGAYASRELWEGCAERAVACQKSTNLWRQSSTERFSIQAWARTYFEV